MSNDTSVIKKIYWTTLYLTKKFFKKTLEASKKNFKKIKSFIIPICLTQWYQKKTKILLVFYNGNKTDIQHRKISLIIPTLSKGKQSDHFPKLKKLLSEYLPKQTYKNYEANVWCDGPNEKVEKMVMSLHDERIKVYSSKETIGLWGMPQTRQGIEMAEGDFFVRMNDDNIPYKNYLQTLIEGFEEGVGIVYGRVIFRGEARRRWGFVFKEANSFILPKDKEGTLCMGNIDCMNYMVRMDLAKSFVNNWINKEVADWNFIETLLKNNVKAVFINKIIGEKF